MPAPASSTFPRERSAFPTSASSPKSAPPRSALPTGSRYQWEVLREELEETRELAKKLKLWTVFGAPHRLTPPHRPHNSLYVISDRGELVTRYDERLLSHTKISFMYSPGKIPVTFEVDGLRFGCAAGMESHYPEIFIEYERLDVDCVLFSTSGETPSAAPPFAAEVLGLAASNTYWVSYASHAPQSVIAPPGIAAPNGQWAALCPADGTPGIAFADIATNPWKAQPVGARQSGLEALVAPVRPTKKPAYPLTSFADYISWTTADGAPFDPWVRKHWQLGARLVKIAPCSMRVQAPLSQWTGWSGLRFPVSGPYHVEGGLAPLMADCETGLGLYEEPNVWMRHRLEVSAR